MNWFLADEAATLRLAARMAARLPAGPFVLHLHGDLGTGKTTLTRGMLHALGRRGQYAAQPMASLPNTPLRRDGRCTWICIA